MEAEGEDGNYDGECDDDDNDILKSGESIIVSSIGGLSCAENDVSDDEDAW